jgi:hypothetical protein
VELILFYDGKTQMTSVHPHGTLYVTCLMTELPIPIAIHVDPRYWKIFCWCSFVVPVRNNDLSFSNDSFGGMPAKKGTSEPTRMLKRAKYDLMNNEIIILTTIT